MSFTRYGLIKGSIGLVAVLMALVLPVHAQENVLVEARQHTKLLAMELQKALKNSIEKEGLEASVAACNVEAPVISKQLSQDGWTVGRTALKLRNSNNAPSDWEEQTLHYFSDQMAKGVAPASLERSLTEDGRFYYMKAIPTGGACLACHGGNITQSVATKIDGLYPEDQAKGFQLGELRGAFTLSKQLN
jgi:hypothetical protein